MPETESSSNTGPMNDRITTLLREDAAELRRMHAAGAGIDDLRARKQTLLGDFYRMLCIHLGEPPQAFVWQWRDKDNAFHRDGELTPASFRRYVDYDLDSMACLIHCPTADKPLNRALHGPVPRQCRRRPYRALSQRRSASVQAGRRRYAAERVSRSGSAAMSASSSTATWASWI